MVARGPYPRWPAGAPLWHHRRGCPRRCGRPAARLVMAATNRAPRVVYFGMFGPLSRVPLGALLDAGVDVAAVVVPPRADAADGPGGSVRRLLPPSGYGARPPSLQNLLRETAVELAWRREIPVLE